MGYLPEPTPEMGEYWIEHRRESFYLAGESNYNDGVPLYVKRRHAITTYENGDTGQGPVEILIEDIPKIRAALDQVERVHNGSKE